MNRTIERTYVGAKVLESIATSWTFATYVLFLTGLGLPLFQVNLLNVVFMSISSLLDPFTGNLGDRVGQKRVYLGGLVFWGLGMFIYGNSRIFALCAIAEATAAIGHALSSEALESWLRNHTTEEVTHRTMSQAQFWGKLATIPAALLGGYLGSQMGMEWPWFFSFGTSLAAAGLVWWQLRRLPEKPEDNQEEEAVSLSLLTIAKNAWSDPVLKRAFVAVALLSASFQPFNMFWAPVFREASGKADWLGGLWMGIALTTALGSYLATKVKVSAKVLALIVGLIGMPMFLPLVRGNWIVLMMLPFLVHEIGRSMWAPILFTYTNRRIHHRVRTSVNSLRSSAGTIGAAVGLLVSGWLTFWLSPVQVWAVSATILLLTAIWIGHWNHEG